MEELRDIKPPLELPFLSYVVYWVVIVVSIILLLSLGYYLFNKYYKNFQKKKEFNALEKLESLDMSNSKDFAYRATYYGAMLLDSPQKEEIFEELKLDLEKYKYRKNVEPLDEVSKEIFYRFMSL